MPDNLRIIIGGDLPGPPNTVTETVSDSIGITQPDPVVTISGAHSFNPTEQTLVGLSDSLSVTLWRDPPDDARQPTADQFLNTGGSTPMPSGWAARTQHAISSGVKTFLSQGIPIDRNRGVIADEETVDIRGVTINVSPRIASDHSAPVNLNHIHTIARQNSKASTSCSLRPALVGSTPSTAKSQVGRVWGLHNNTSDSGLSYTAVPENSGWRRWKNEAKWAGEVIDGQQVPWDTEAACIDCKLATGSALWTDPKQRSYVEGVWWRHIMDGPCSCGSMLEVRNCLFQYVHDDAHEQDVGYAPLYLYRNLYWGIFTLASYRNTGQPDNSAMTSVVEDCVIGLNRQLPYPFSEQFAGDDPNTCWDQFMHGDLIKTGQSGKPPKYEFHNTVVLMMGQPGQGGFAANGTQGEGYLPAGSTADQNCHFVYLDVHGDGGKLPTSAPSGKVTFAQAGFNVHYGTSLNDQVVKDFFWPAVQKWIDDHPQYGMAPMTTNAASNVAILNGT